VTEVINTNIGTSYSQAWAGVNNAPPNLYWNTDPVNTIYLCFTSNPIIGANTIPIPPNGSMVIQGNQSVYAIAKVAGAGPLIIIPNGSSQFLGITQGGGALTGPLYFYNGAIALGNLVGSIDATSGFDHVGNATLPGFVTYIPNGSGGYNAISFNNGAITPYSNTTYGGTYTTTNSVIINNKGEFVYSGAPALGNLIASIAGAAGTDAFSNAFAKGFQTGDTIINTSGIFVYSGTPAAGNLELSITAATGTDPFGNTYLAGFSWYAYGTTNVAISISPTGQVLAWYSFTAQPGAVFTQTNNPVIQWLTVPGSILEITNNGSYINLGAAGPEVPNLAIDNSGIEAANVTANGGGNLRNSNQVDLNNYYFGKVIARSGSVLINSTTPKAIFTSINIGDGGQATYRFNAMIPYVCAAGAGTPSFEINVGDIVTIVAISDYRASTSGIIVNTQVFNGSLVVHTGPTMVASGLFAWRIEGFVSVSAPTTFNVSAFTSAAADTFTCAAGSYLELEPTT
jgi:hypothetical protein